MHTGDMDRSSVLRRQVPRYAALRELLRPAPVELDGVQRRLNRAASITDLRELARKRVPRAVFDFADGAAGVGELALQRARDVFSRMEFHPSVLNDVSQVSTETMILGKPSAQPFMLAPTGLTRIMDAQGELAVIPAAQEAGIPYSLSTMGTVTIEDITRAAPNGRRWFQLYLWHDRSQAADLVDRAAAAGYDALMVTVDVPVAGERLRDVHNGMTIPPQLSLGTFLDGARHPRWSIDLLTTEPLNFANFTATGGNIASIIDRMFDPGATVADLEWLRGRWKGKLVVKGILSAADARRAAEVGADAVILSSHGGRQLDRAALPIELVPAVRESLDDRVELFVDTGIMSGADIVAAVAMGANAALVGRAYLYGLMAGGRRGVTKAVNILSDEVSRTMALLGVTSIDQLRPEHVSIRPH
jgi:L-lactate dehydrogenase (cytochrome)